MNTHLFVAGINGPPRASVPGLGLCSLGVLVQEHHLHQEYA
jgi:hypothetical protein